jgi:HPt (histidine-containing phosphotransfer) domain-containing protein
VHANLSAVAARIRSLRWALLGIATVWIVAALHLHEQREQGVRALRAAVEGMASGEADALSSQLRNIDQTLLYARALYTRDNASIDLAAWVNSAEAATRRVWPIAFAGANGLLTYSDLRRVTSQVDISNLPPFRHFADQASVRLDDHLFIGKPVRMKEAEAPVIAFARPLTTPFGRFDGIAMMTIDAHALAPMLPFAGATVVVTGLDAVVRATRGGRAAPGDISTSPAISDAGDQVEGSFVALDAYDHTTRITGFRRIDSYPLLVEVALCPDLDAIGLHDNRGPVVAMALVLSLAILAAGISCAKRSASVPHVHERAAPERATVRDERVEVEEAPAIAAKPAATATSTLEHLKDAVGTGAVAGVVSSFLDGLPRQLNRMHTLANADELDTLVREAHTLASSAAAIGLDQLAAAASELEQDARHQPASAIEARLDRIELLARPATARLDAYLHPSIA